MNGHCLEILSSRSSLNELRAQLDGVVIRLHYERNLEMSSFASDLLLYTSQFVEHHHARTTINIK